VVKFGCARQRQESVPGRRLRALISLQITGNRNAVFTVLINIWSAKAVYSLNRIIARDQQLVWP
jgi:hypothetical protein